jgi:glycosyltransferase involved in cell wall biosynthesis
MTIDGLMVVIPALNEAATIGSIVDRCKGISGRVIVVDDGSSDNTGRIAAAAGATVIRHDRPMGYDAALASGLNHAFHLGARSVVTCDADGQHRIEDIVRISDPVSNGEVEFCAGIRDRYNRPIEALIGMISTPLFGTRDPFCGLKCYGRPIYERWGPFPSQLNIGTVPLVWVKKSELRRRFLPIHVEGRHDSPRFGTMVRASLKLTYAFARSAAKVFSCS